VGIKSAIRGFFSSNSSPVDGLQPMDPQRGSSSAASPSQNEHFPDALHRRPHLRQLSNFAATAVDHTGNFLRKISSGASGHSSDISPDIPSIRLPDRRDDGGPMFEFTTTPPEGILKPIAIKPPEIDEER
jgi:hypothetical protein